MSEFKGKGRNECGGSEAVFRSGNMRAQCSGRVSAWINEQARGSGQACVDANRANAMRRAGVDANIATTVKGVSCVDEKNKGKEVYDSTDRGRL